MHEMKTVGLRATQIGRINAWPSVFRVERDLH